MDDNPRKHFEKIIQELSLMYKEDRMSIRDEIKMILSSRRVIKFSTTELAEDDLKRLANILHSFWADQDQRPPDDRALLDLPVILNNFCHEFPLPPK